MKRRGGKRGGAAWKKPPALTKITREIHQKHWRANHHDYIYLENRIFSTWRKVLAEGIFVNHSNFTSWLLGKWSSDEDKKKNVWPWFSASIAWANKATTIKVLQFYLKITCIGLNRELLIWLFADFIVQRNKSFFCFSFNKRSPKDAARKTEFFLHTLFLENEEQTNEKKFRAMSVD